MICATERNPSCSARGSGTRAMGLGSLVVFLLMSISKMAFLRTYVSAFGQNFPVFLLLLGYLFGTLGYAVYSNGLYVMHRERLFLWASLVTFPAGIVLKLLGAWLLGLRGLAAGTSVYWIVWASVLAVCFWWAVGLKQINARSARSPSPDVPRLRRGDAGIGSPMTMGKS